MDLPLAGYIRVSHVGGRSGDRFHSPDDQAVEIRAWAKARGRRVDLLPPELDGKGTDAKRPIFRGAVDGVRSGAYAGVVVAYLSRAGRDLRLMLDLWDEVEAAGGAVFCARENIDASTPSGRLQRNLLASIAQHELEERRDGFERAAAGAVERGIWQRRQTPTGYRRDDATRRLVPDARDTDVRGAFRDRAAGASIAVLADRLGMTRSGVRHLLRNRVYLGELRVRSYVNAAAHEPLVDVDTFEAAQRSVARPARRAQRAPALLAGLIRCAGCGHLMTRGGNAKVPAYACPTSHSGERCPAPAAITLARLDAHVERIALDELQRLAVIASDGRGAERARTALAAAEAELAAYLVAISAADVGAEAFAAGARERRQSVDAAREALRIELGREQTLPAFHSGADAWDELNGSERNALLRALLAAVVVKRAGGRGARTSLDDRVRVLAHGTDLRLPQRRGGEATGIIPIALPDLDEPGVLGMPRSEDRAQGVCGARQMAA